MLDGLTPRQREIVSLIEQGRSNKEIAALLDIGVGTVKQHVAALFRRLNVTSRAQAVASLRGLSAAEPMEPSAPVQPMQQHHSKTGSQETSALGAECRVLSVAALVLEPAETMAQSLGTRLLLERLEKLAGLGRQAAETLGGQCFERAGQGIELRFGLNRARGDDAARAVRAARFVLENMALSEEPGPKPRGGVATGVGVVMAQTGFPARPLASSELAHAWRLAHSAPSGRLLACEATQRLTAHVLNFEAAPGTAGLGRAALVRGDAQMQPPALLAPPRRELLDRLQDLSSRSSCLAVEAAHGLGRTTLASALGQRIESTGGMSLYIPASRRGLGTDPTGLGLALEIKLGLGLAEDDSQRAARLDAFLAAQDAQNPLVRQPLLSLIVPSSPAPVIPDLSAALAGLAGKHPLTLLVDDAEETSPMLAEVLARLFSTANPTLRLVLFTKGLPENLLRRLSPLERVKMSPLSEEDMATLVKGLDADNLLDESLLRAVVRQAQGRPGDGVELTLAMLTRIRAKGEGAAPLGLPMPLRLYASLIAEMDPDPDVREALRLAALLGRFFAPGLLARFWPRGQKALDEALSRAVSAQLLTQEGSGASVRFSFSRPLLREAAVLSWLTADRSRLRARIERTRVRVGTVPLAPAGEARLSPKELSGS
ncbi:MAG: LuxR C-terminal-related transcriptional regulator [Rhodospirillales bacterium]|jgi:DNA-binding CsgD family transcriptional regulator